MKGRRWLLALGMIAAGVVVPPALAGELEEPASVCCTYSNPDCVGKEAAGNPPVPIEYCCYIGPDCDTTLDAPGYQGYCMKKCS